MKRALVLLLLGACGHGATTSRPATTLIPYSQRGQPVLLDLPSLDGGDLATDHWRGHPVVIHVTDTSSLAGLADLDEERAARTARSDVSLVEVMANEPAGLAGPWRNAAEVDWPVLLGGEDLVGGQSPLGEVPLIPSTFVLDADGRVAWRWAGQLPKGALVNVVHDLGAVPTSP